MAVRIGLPPAPRAERRLASPGIVAEVPAGGNSPGPARPRAFGCDLVHRHARRGDGIFSHLLVEGVTTMIAPLHEDETSGATPRRGNRAAWAIIVALLTVIAGLNMFVLAGSWTG
jgi:hypothetical protein